MLNIKVGLPRVHMAGSNAHYDAHLEVGQHGFALFLAPDAETPVLDVDGSSDELRAFVHELQAALAVRHAPGVGGEGDAVQLVLPRQDARVTSRA
jgi:hypothetical protein